ncbi:MULTISPECIES: hypothetical protein [Bacillus]|uniref:Uncharacterized protein n=1 Tax=Bacillus glycinifermentans TaxID=1664069 RepID=A0AAJ3Z012_9BACI|nr:MULTISPECIES: hypothetical protein [Bacillus]MBU8787112.1 hypothetical protein [Bacillus glycinifermentans]MDU0070062.1 hypothetical protein [Bacillus sp. IG6]MED8017735.1 hypothetical protein [Bacillus glycinifermentans]NUJ16186.1 hypothetical protein [Bacillus glycinifermentans]QAT66397.1 hypothetical protein EQZ20_16820 [Bacillus glycinifermentans]
MKTIPAIAFKAKNKKGRYLSDGPDCDDWSDPNGDVENLEDAFCIVKVNLESPSVADVEMAYNLFDYLKFGPSSTEIKEHYEPVYVELTQQQFQTIKKRNEWEVPE